ncbi:hypothetical protein Tco_1164253 [Tanacetum coccineum]
MNQNFYNSNSSGFDQIQPPQYYVMHQPPEESVKEFKKQLKTVVISALEGVIQPPQETSVEILQAKEDLMKSIQTFLKKFNHLQIIRKELAEYINSPSWNRPAFYDDDDDDEYTIQYREYLENLSNAIAPDLPTEEPDNSLSMGDEHLCTISETESDKLIKSSVENLSQSQVSPREFSNDTCDVPFCDNSPPLDILNNHFKIFFDFNNDCTSSDDDSFEDIDYVEASPPDSELVSLEEVKDNILHEKLWNINLLIACDLPLSDDFSPITIFEEKSMTFSNPLFDSNDDSTSSDNESLSDEDVPVLEDIECKDSYDSNLDESTLLVTPLFDSNKDECLALSDDIELLLHHDSSINVVSILEGFTDEPPLEENYDLFDLESKENDWKKILYDAPIDDLITEDKVLDPEIHEKKFSPTYIDPHYFNAESNLIESLLNRDILIDSSPKFDYLLEEFSGELAHIDPIPPGIEKADFDLEEEICLVENLLYDNSSPRPSEELNLEIADTIIESPSPSPIPVTDSDSLIEEIDLFLATNDSRPPGIEDDNYDSEGDICFLEELLNNDSLPFLKMMVGDISEHDVLMPNLLPTQSTLCPVFDPLIPFSSENEDKVFNPGPARPVVIREPDSGRIQPLLNVQGKGKEKVVDEKAAHDLLTLQNPKKKSPADQFIFQRRTPIPTEALGTCESPFLDGES